MRKLAFAAALAVLIPGAAGAADIPSIKDHLGIPQAPGTSVVNWSGSFIGIHIGYGWGNWEGTRDVARKGGHYHLSTCRVGKDTLIEGLSESECTDQDGDYLPPKDNDLPSGFTGGRFDEFRHFEENTSHHTIDGIDGIFGGARIGYRFQYNGFVFGPFVDGSISRAKGTTSWERIGEVLDENGDTTGEEFTENGSITIKERWNARGGLMLGVVIGPRDMIYGFGTLNFGSFNARGGSSIEEDAEGIVATAYNNTDTAWGYGLGIGLEHAFNAHWSIGVEGAWSRYTDIGASIAKTTDYADNCYGDGCVDAVEESINGDFEKWDIRASLNYRF